MLAIELSIKTLKERVQAIANQLPLENNPTGLLSFENTPTGLLLK